MAVRYVEAPDVIGAGDVGAGRPSVFLAGGISQVEDWQRRAVQALEASGVDMTVYNPRRVRFDVADVSAAPRQVAWEFTHLRLADVVAFWFAASDARVTVQPIALLELGAAMERSQPIVVGVDADYPRRLDVELQVSNAASAGLLPGGLAVHGTLETTLSDVVGKLSSAR